MKPASRKPKLAPKILISQDKWDSTFFRRKIGRMHYVNPEKLSYTSAVESLNESIQKTASLAFKYLVFTVPTGYPSLDKALKKNRFRLVDLSVDFELGTGHRNVKKEDRCYSIEAVQKEDLSCIAKIAAYSFRLSRLYKIKFATRKKVDHYHALWVRNLYNDRRSSIFIAELGKRICGFLAVTQDRKDRSVRIILIAAARNMQGKGVGCALLDHLILWAKKKKLSTIYVKTQKNNVRALNFYKKLGFKSYCEERKYHRYL